MMRLAKLQLIGPVALFVAIAASEAAVYGLAQSPSSQALWYVNIELFGAFQRSHYLLSPYLDVHYLQLLAVALPLLAVALVGYALRHQFLLAIASNLSFVY